MIPWESFDKNEVFLIILNIAAYLVVFLLPKKLTLQMKIFGLLWGFSVGTLFDFTIGGGLVDYYRVNDLNNYEVTDIFYYLLFAPFGYFFFYFYEVFRISKSTFIVYVLTWSLIGVAALWLLTLMDIITFQKGFKLSYSFPVFLVTQTITGIYFIFVKIREQILVNK